MAARSTGLHSPCTLDVLTSFVVHFLMCDIMPVRGKLLEGVEIHAGDHVQQDSVVCDEVVNARL